MRMLTDKRGLTPVVASIILCGVVLILGTSVWSLTYSISRGLQESYYEDVKKQIDAIRERFTIEHIYYDNDTGTLHVWVYNYGDIDVDVDIYVMGDAKGSNVGPTHISSKDFTKITVPLGDLNPGSELVIEVISRRQNVVYQPYIVPAA